MSLMSYAGHSKPDSRGIARIDDRTIYFKRSYNENSQESSITVGINNLMVTYQDGDRAVFQIEEYLKRKYTYTLTGLLINLKHPALEPKKPLVHGYPLRTLLWLKSANKDTVNDRVVMVTGLIGVNEDIYAWMSDHYPCYKVKHINHKAPQLTTRNYVISKKLQNGSELIRGGEGAVAVCDIELITIPTTYGVQYDYLLLQNFIKQKQIKALKSHCRRGAEGWWNALELGIRRMLFKTAGSFDGTKQKQSLFIPKEYIDKEFSQKIKSVISVAVPWIYNRSKTSKYFIFEFEPLYAAFGNKIIRNYREPNTRAFTIQCTELKIIYYPKSKSLNNMKLEGLIKKAYI